MDPKRIYYDHTSSSDKFFFGGYLNLAINNIHLVFNAYKERFNINKEVEEYETITNDLKNLQLSDSDFNQRINFLSHHLPFLLYLDKSNKEKFCEKIYLLVKAIDNLRNFYTHYYHKPLNFDKEFYTTLDELLLKVVDYVRKNRFKNEETKILLNTRLKKELEILIKKQKDKLLEDKKKGKIVFTDNETIKNSIYNRAFHHLTYKAVVTVTENGKEKKEIREVLSKYYKAELIAENGTKPENGITISQSGLIFLLGLFLTKKEGEDLRAKIEGFKAKTKDIDEEYPSLDSNSLKFIATHWVFSHLAFKGLKSQLSTSYDKETLLLQIADELSKVPDAVYKALPKDLQDTFVEDINEYIKEEDDEISPLSESTVVHPVIRKRYENKFNYFVIRFLDEFINFPSLRFQIYLGNYVHDKREKEIAGTLFHTERIIKEKINAFARLSDACKNKEIALKIKDNDNPIGWEKFPNPSYNIEDGNIMIYLSIDKGLKDKIKEYKKTKVKSSTRREKRVMKYKMLLEIAVKDIINNSEPIALFSLNELPALLYEILIRPELKQPSEIEAIIRKHFEEQFNKIENYPKNKETQELSDSQFPSNLVKRSLGITINKEKLLNRISNEIEATNQRLTYIENKRKELEEKTAGKPKRKYLFNKKEIGEISTWLTYDLLRMMPAEDRKNWKGYQHSQLQQSLAFYDLRPNEAFNLLSAVWHFDDDAFWWNKKIKDIFKERSFNSFYQKYLLLRLDIYKNIFSVLNNNEGNNELFNNALEQQHVPNLIKKREYTIDTIDNLKQKLLAQPIPLGRGFFDDKPTFIKGVKIHEQPDRFADWYRYAVCNEEEYQSFYEYERDYTELYEAEKLKPAKEQKKSIKKLRLENDLYIKKLKIQDLFLKAIAEKLYEDVFGQKITFNLKDFYLTREEKLNKIKIANQQKHREKGDKSENKLRETFIWDKTVTYKYIPYKYLPFVPTIYKYAPYFDFVPPIKGLIIEEAVKLKDLGKFKRLIADPKTAHILEYKPNRIWNKLELEKELESYEKIRREELFKAVQAFEEKILLKNGSDGKNHIEYLEKKNNPHFKYYVTKGLLSNRGDVSKEEVEWLNNVTEKDFELKETIDELRKKPVIIQKGYMVIYIRNKFAHNQLLHPLLFTSMLDLCGEKVADDETYSETILRSLNKMIGDLLA